MPRNGANSTSSLPKQLKSSCASEASLAISEEIFDEKAVRALIEEWIVPALVEAFLRNLVQDWDRSKDNRGQPWDAQLSLASRQTCSGPLPLRIRSESAGRKQLNGDGQFWKNMSVTVYFNFMHFSKDKLFNSKIIEMSAKIGKREENHLTDLE